MLATMASTNVCRLCKSSTDATKRVHLFVELMKHKGVHHREDNDNFFHIIYYLKISINLLMVILLLIY